MRISLLKRVAMLSVLFVAFSSFALAQICDTSFGYCAYDQNDSPGPTYTFFDISTTGTDLLLSDDGEANVALGFVFPFYNHSASAIRVGNNGAILVDVVAGGVSFVNDCPLPSTDTDPRIHVFWDDLDSDDGATYFEGFAVCPVTQPVAGAGDCMIVQWENRPHFPGSPGDNGVTLQAILYENGDIAFQYEDTSFGIPDFDDGASASIGIEDDEADPDFFLEYSCNTASVDENHVILITTRNILVGVEAGSQTNVTGTHLLTNAYPNPFNPQTHFQLAVARGQEVRVEVFDSLGRAVATLFEGPMAAQTMYRFTFEAGFLSSGVYIIRASGETFADTQQITLLK